MKNDFWPKRENDQVLFLDTFSTQLPTHQVQLASAVSVGDLTTARNIFLWYAWAVLQCSLFEAERKQRVAFKNTLRDNPDGVPTATAPEIGSTVTPVVPVPVPGFLSWLRDIIARIKAHPAYSEAIGQDLGIVTGPATVPTKPVGEALAMTGCCSKVSFLKAGYSGVKVESQRNAESQWSNLGTRIRAEFVDDRAPLVPGTAEMRRYRLTYLDGDTPVGEASDIISVIVAP